MSDWRQRRITLAKRLNEGECDGDYGDAVLILSAVLSGIAADLWPGKGKDRKRFVEIWARYADPTLSPNLISLPLLIEDLEEKQGNVDLAKKVRGTRPGLFWPEKIERVPDDVKVIGPQVDQTETSLMALDYRLTAKKLREFSYGSIFYEHLRSGYTHEYHPTEYASSVTTVTGTFPISYRNLVKPPYKQFHFNFDWVAELVESVLASVVASVRTQPLPEPQTWWVDG